MSEVENKLAAARTRLILDKPFLGALVLRLPLVEADPHWCPTSATDARSLYYNPDYIDGLSLGQVQFVLAHEALHCALSHFARREHRSRRRWDVACDYAVNPLLVDDGLPQPPGVLFDERFTGMAAEEIYPCLSDTDLDEPMDRHLYDDGAGEGAGDEAGEEAGGGAGDASEQTPDEETSDPSTSAQGDAPHHPERQTGPESTSSRPPSLGAAERQRLETQWRQRLAGAAQQAMMAGKLKGAIARLVEQLLQPTVPWRNLLAHHMVTYGRDDYDLMRPSRRREGDAILPSLHKRKIDVVVAIDTSGSIQADEMDQFLAEINAIKAQVSARITLLACDDELHDNGPWVFETWQELRQPERFKGGGGTDFRPVFAWTGMQFPAPDLLIYFTDARGRFPDNRPAVPTLWLVKGAAEVPFGQRIQLN